MGILFKIIEAMAESADERKKREAAQRIVEGFRQRVDDPLVSEFFEKRLKERREEWDGSGN